jgi:hypothetical protein
LITAFINGDAVELRGYWIMISHAVAGRSLQA